MDVSSCYACSFAIEDGDNFCRRCGVAVATTQVPATSAPSAVTVWRPQASPVVKGAAVMAAGTIGQFVFRRVISGLLGGAKPRKRRAIQVRSPHERDGLVDEAQIITETVMMRRVRIRRQV